MWRVGQLAIVSYTQSRHKTCSAPRLLGGPAGTVGLTGICCLGTAQNSLDRVILSKPGSQ